MMSTTSPVTRVPKSGGRLLLWLGILATIAGIVTYIFQLKAARLTTPWYAPGLATLGTVLVVVSLVRSVTVWRMAALLLVGAVTAGEWWFIAASKLPAYAGPAAEGKAFPEFTAALVDGKTFTQEDLKGNQHSVLVFFRGYW